MLEFILEPFSSGEVVTSRSSSFGEICLRSIYFQSVFASGAPGFYEIFVSRSLLPQKQKVYETCNPGCLVTVRFSLRNSRLCQVHLRRCQFSSYFASERLSFHKVLPQKCLLSDFTSERLSFCQILPQEIFLSVKFCLQTLCFLSNFFPQSPLVSLIFCLRTPRFCPNFASEASTFFLILPFDLNFV